VLTLRETFGALAAELHLRGGRRGFTRHRAAERECPEHYQHGHATQR
jgi:hypothetical protein